MSSRGDWIQTYTGKKFYPWDPRPGDICLEDIAHHLSNICRFSGATSRFYSVAEHSCYVSASSEEHGDKQLAKYGLLHDAAEAYIGDMTRTLKHHDAFTNFRNMEAKIEIAICERFNLEGSMWDKRFIKYVEQRLLMDEIYCLMPDPKAYLERWPVTEPWGIPIVGVSPPAAETIFLVQAQVLGIK